MLKIEVVDNETALGKCVDDWSQLAAAATPMQSPAWLRAWWHAHQTPQDRLAVVLLRDTLGAVVGLAPWYQSTSLATGTTLRFLGSGRACSDFQTVLCRSDMQGEVIGHLCDWLSRRPAHSSHAPCPTSPRWDLIDLEGLSANHPVMDAFLIAMRERGHMSHFRSSESTWRIDLAGGWQGFLSRQSKTQRSQTRNLVNRFDKSSDLNLQIASELNAQSDSIIETLMELHAMRWRAAGGQGCFAQPAMKNFFTDAMRTMIATGQAEIVVLRRNEQPLAAQALLVQAGQFYMYQSGRDPAEDAQRVGRIANLVTLRWMCERGATFIDYLRGDESYKSRMRAEPAASHRVRIVARANFPELRHKIWLACRVVKTRWQDRKPSVIATQDDEVAETTSTLT